MRISIISIGSELLIGRTVNTNLAFIGDQLASAGYTVDREICIPDDPAVMEETIRREIAESQLVITIGGLGPTRDDLTRDTAARVLGVDLLEVAAVRRHIEQYLGPRRQLIPEPAIRIQSQVPTGATVLFNHNGTAPGLWCPARQGVLVLLPGPPRELQPLFIEEVLPRVIESGPPDSCRRSLTVCGLPESRVAEKLEQSLELPAEVEIAYCARAGEVDIRLTASPAMASCLTRLQKAIIDLFGPAALTTDLVTAIADSLRSHGRRLAVAESCTGGMLEARITDKAGASAFFSGGVVCYSNRIKEQLLAVPGSVLSQHGAVSEECARALAQGVRHLMATEAAVAVTGIAGPDGGTVDKPVGLVYIATAVEDRTRTRKYVFTGSRERIRSRAVTTALNDLRLHLLNH